MEGTRLEKPARRIPWFYIIYFSLLILAGVLIFLVCHVARDLLAEYEGAQPKYVAEAAFETYFSPVNYDRLLSEARYNAGVASDEQIIEYLKAEIGDTGLTWSVGSSDGPDELRYIVKAGRKQIGSIGLTAAPETTEHGFQSYTLSYVELDLRPDAIPGGILTVTAPAGYTVTLDGVTLTDGQRTGSYLAADTLKYYPEGVPGIEFVTYTVPGLTSLPREISVTTLYGGMSDVTFDRQASAYYAGIAYSPELEEAYGRFVTDAVQGYAAFMHRAPGSGLSKIKSYFDQTSALYQAMQLAEKDLYINRAPERNEFTDLKIGEFYAYTEDIFSCHISFTQVLLRSYAKDYDSIDMYVFLHRSGDDWLIYQWYNNA